MKDEMNGDTVLQGEITDARTGEIIPVGEIQKPQSNTLATSLDLTRVGTLELDDRAEVALAEPLNPEDVQIRPDGLVYLPWTWYASRLNKAFGRLQWGLVPQSGPQSKNTGSFVLVVWGHWLVVKGVPVGFEMGETSYNPSNNTMSYGDAAAGAKSNSLARNCKMLGMSLELWNQDWISNWKKEYAETYEDRGKTKWRKKVKKTEKVEKVETVVGNVSKETWDKHAEALAKDANQEPSNEPVYETLYSLADLKAVKMIAKLAKDSGKEKSEVAIALGKMDKSGSYSISEIIKMLEGA